MNIKAVWAAKMKAMRIAKMKKIAARKAAAAKRKAAMEK